MLSTRSLIPALFALAPALASPMPAGLAIALGFAAEADPASYECHASCGYAIIAARECSSNGADDGTFDASCLCTSDSQFISLLPDCLDCGWCLWDDYGKYLTTPLSVCEQPTEPTGTQCKTATSTSEEATSTEATSTSEEATSTEATSTSEAAPETTSSEAAPETTSSEAAPETTSSEAAPETSSEAAPETTSSEAAPETTSSVEATTSEATSESAPTVEASTSASSTIAAVENYTGGAAQYGVAGAAALAGFAALLM